MVFLSHWIDEASQANKITVWFLDEAPNSWSPNREEKRGGCVYGGRVVEAGGRVEKAQRRKEVRIRMAAKAEGCSKVVGAGPLSEPVVVTIMFYASFLVAKCGHYSDNLILGGEQGIQALASGLLSSSITPSINSSSSSSTSPSAPESE